MAKKLDYTTSIQIVFSVLRETSHSTSFSGDTLIGTVLADPAQRELFREKIRDNVRAAGYGIKWKSIPVEPHTTVEHIAAALTGLAGDPGGVHDE